MRILAVDPGYDRIGVAVMEHGDDSGKEKLLYSTCITTNKTATLPSRLQFLGSEFQKLLNEYTPTHIALETLFFNKNQTTGIAVAQARGILVYLGKESNCTVCEYGPQEIKVAVTGYGNSDKKAVTEMVKRLVPDAPKKGLDDEYDAIAVGITALAHNRR